MKSLKSSKLKIVLVILFLIIFCGTCVFADNEEITTEENYEDMITTTEEDSNEELDGDSINSLIDAIANQKVETSDKYIFENKVEITSTVSGNAFIMANEVVIDAAVDGNVFIMANKVTFSANSYIYSDAFVMANEVTVNGYMYDLYCMANSLTINNGGCIIRDLHTSCSTFNFGGLIRRDAFVTTNKIVTDDANANIAGKLSYSAPTNNFPTAIVSSGEIEYNELNSEVSSVQDYVKDCIYTLVVAVIVILIITLAIPKFADKEEKLLKNKLGNVVGFGAIALIMIPIVCLIACFTIIGILPSMIVFFMYVLALQIASSIVAVPIAKIIYIKIKKETNLFKILIALAYVFVMWLLGLVPGLSILLVIANSILALGLIVCSIFKKNVEKKNK